MAFPNLRKHARKLLPIAAVVILVAAAVLLFRAMREYRYADIVARFKSYSPSVLLAALALTALNYFVLSFYDVLALKYVVQKVPYPRTFFTSFLSYVFSYNIGLSVFGSSAIRLRFYSLWGVEGVKIAKIVTFCIATFWLGLAATGGAALLSGPAIPDSLAWLKFSSRALGVLLLGAAIAYAAACASGKAVVSFGRFRFSLPSFPVALGQFLVASLDWIIAAFVLYILLPSGALPFLKFLPLFMIAQLASATSHVPGGVGVLETVVVLTLAPYVDSGDAFGALMAYRGVFYLAPLASAIVLFVGRELRAMKGRTADIVRAAAPLVPALLSAAVFAAGGLLLFSAATPSASYRLELFRDFFPLALLETSHFAASLIGVALLLIADGLRRRVDAAYFAALGLLAAGAFFSVLKAFEWEEALALAGVIALLAPARKLFHRRAVLFAKPNALWVLAVCTLTAAIAWIGLFATKHVQYANELWWKFEFSHDAPRMLRASLGIAVVAAIAGLRLLLGTKPKLPAETLESSGADIERVLAASSAADANLALLGDKLFHFGPDRRSFVMYARSGGTCVAMGDPAGNEEEFPALVWDFYETARRQGLRVAWYEISADRLGLFIELGLKIVKIGEEASVDLAGFTMNGAAGKRLRPPCNKMEKDGYSFEVVPAERTEELADELKRISDEWLASKKAKEKGFSLGFFDSAYVSRFAAALVMKDRRIAAFATLWKSGDGKEAAVDLMRHVADAPNGTMEYLFVRCIEWAQEHGFERFSLGVAPFSGIEARESAPLWNKAVAAVFRTGESVYNFQGLRAFKSKFHPRWRPRYIAADGGTALALISADIALLISKTRKDR